MGRLRCAIGVTTCVPLEGLTARVPAEVVARAGEGHAHPLLGRLDGLEAHGIDGPLGYSDEVGIDGYRGHGATVPHVAAEAQA